MRARCSPIPRGIAFQVAALLAVLLAAPVFGGTTGKLAGRVVDEKNAPVVGANIRIEGLRLGALSDDQGQFVIIGVPAGTYTVRADLMGHVPYVVQSVTIVPDFTTTLPAVLKTEAIPVAEVEVQAERPLLQRDATGTTRFISAQEVQALPTRGYRDAAAQQTGVVNFQRQIDNETQNGNTLIIRGGRPNETVYYVDGFSQQDPLTGSSSTAINNNAIEEIVLLTGGFSPEYGKAMSGAVNVITREGSQKYSGALEAVSDVLAGDWIGAPIVDYNIYDAHIAGPILPSRSDLTFFLSGERRWQRDRTPTFMPDVTRSLLTTQGLDPDFKPSNSSGGYSLHGKLAWQLSDQMTLKAGGLGSEDKWSEYLNEYLFNLSHSPRYYDKNQSYFATFNHAPSATMFWNVGLNYFDTLRKRGDGVAFDDLSRYYVRPYPRFDTDLPMFWLPGHVENSYLQRHSSYWGLQGSWTSQVTRHNQLKGGAEYQRHTLRYFQHYRPTNLGGSNPDNTNWNGYGYDLQITPDPNGGPAGVKLVENGDDSPDGPKHPKTWALYAQDKFEREGVVVNGGLRFDHINVDTPALLNDGAPLSAGPYPDSLDQADLTENRTYARLSPRLGVSFPLDDKTLVRFNYGQFYQQPNLQDLYVSYRFMEYKLQTGGYFVGFGNPNLKPERTTAYEVGVGRQIGDRSRIDLTAYYKDVKDLVEITNISTQPGALSKQFSSYRNRDYATIKGVDIGYLMRRTNHVAASVNYSLSFAQGTGSVSNTQRNIAWVASEPPRQTFPLDFDQRHKVSVNLDVTFEKGEGPVIAGLRPFADTGINVLYNVASGTPYTPTTVFNEVTLAAVSSLPSGPLNSRYGPWTQTLDLKASKTLPVSGARVGVFLWVLNLFDTRNVYSVFTSSGSASTTNWLNTDDGRAYLYNAQVQGKDGLGAYDLAENNPSFYGNPRLVRFGLRTSF